MKKLVLVLSALLLLVTGTFAKTEHKKITVDNQLSQSFAQKYPHATVKKWYHVGDKDVALFVVDKKKNFAYFLSDGSWVRTETKLPGSHALPGAVAKAWGNSGYESWQVSSVKDVQTPDGEMYTVRANYDYGPEGSIPGDDMDEVRLYYKPDGTFIKKVVLSD